MTKGEREQAAVDRHACPRCKTPKLNRCRSVDPRRTIMKHPHAERVKLVKEDQS
jgi:hypothetical protein